MALAYRKMGLLDDARDACAQALIINSTFKEAILLMAELAGRGSGNDKWEKNAAQWDRMAQTAENFDVLFIRT
jgi:beta-lactamase class D